MKLQNPLTFKKFLTFDSNNAVGFDLENCSLINLSSGLSLKKLENKDFIIALGSPTRIVTAIDNQGQISFEIFNIRGHIIDSFVIPLPINTKLKDLSVLFDSEQQNILLLLYNDKTESFYSYFVDSNKKIIFIGQWNDKTILGDLSSNIFIEKFDKTPENDIFFIKTTDTRIRLSGSVLDLSGNYILVKKEEKLDDTIICYEYLHNKMKLEKKWSHFNGVDAKFIQKKFIFLLEKDEIGQNICLKETYSGTIVKKKKNTGFIDFGIKSSNSISAVSIDTILGINCIYLSSTVIKNELSLLPSLNGILSKTFTLPEGGEATLIYPKNIKGILITIHGGPESREWSNLRHGGLYRILLKKNIGVLIYNYAGSSGLGKDTRTNPHNRWVESITKESKFLFRILETEIIKHRIKYTILAGSFGATIALIISQNKKNLTLFLSSPMLNLKGHINKLTNNKNYKKWFLHRFSNSDINAFSLDELASNQKSKITIFHGEDDVICNPEDSKKFQQINDNSVDLIIVPDFGHVPESQEQLELMYDFFYKKIMREYE